MFLHINLCQMLILKINSICFFLQKSETQSYCRLLHLFELNQIKPNSVVGLQSLINILWTHRLLMVSALWQMHRPTRPIRSRPIQAFGYFWPSLGPQNFMANHKYRPLQAYENVRYFHISNKLRSLSRPIRYIILYRPP